MRAHRTGYQYLDSAGRTPREDVTVSRVCSNLTVSSSTVFRFGWPRTHRRTKVWPSINLVRCAVMQGKTLDSRSIHRTAESSKAINLSGIFWRGFRFNPNSLSRAAIYTNSASVLLGQSFDIGAPIRRTEIWLMACCNSPKPVLGVD